MELKVFKLIRRDKMYIIAAETERKATTLINKLNYASIAVTNKDKWFLICDVFVTGKPRLLAVGSYEPARRKRSPFDSQFDYYLTMGPIGVISGHIGIAVGITKNVTIFVNKEGRCIPIGGAYHGLTKRGRIKFAKMSNCIYAFRITKLKR